MKNLFIYLKNMCLLGVGLVVIDVLFRTDASIELGKTGEMFCCIAWGAYVMFNAILEWMNEEDNG